MSYVDSTGYGDDALDAMGHAPDAFAEFDWDTALAPMARHYLQNPPAMRQPWPDDPGANVTLAPDPTAPPTSYTVTATPTPMNPNEYIPGADDTVSEISNTATNQPAPILAGINAIINGLGQFVQNTAGVIYDTRTALAGAQAPTPPAPTYNNTGEIIPGVSNTTLIVGGAAILAALLLLRSRD